MLMISIINMISMFSMVRTNAGDALSALAWTRAASIDQWLGFGPYTSGMHRSPEEILTHAVQ